MQLNFWSLPCIWASGYLLPLHCLVWSAFFNELRFWSPFKFFLMALVFVLLTSLPLHLGCHQTAQLVLFFPSLCSLMNLQIDQPSLMTLVSLVSSSTVFLIHSYIHYIHTKLLENKNWNDLRQNIKKSLEQWAVKCYGRIWNVSRPPFQACFSQLKLLRWLMDALLPIH